MSAFFGDHAHGFQARFALSINGAGVGDATRHAQLMAQLGCPFTAFAGTEYGHHARHQRTLRVTMVMTASRMPTIQKRAVILLSGIPPFW